MDRREVLTALSGSASVVLAGCGGLGGNRQEKPSAGQLFREEVPRSPINVSLQYTTTENNSEDIKIDIIFEDIPESGEYGSVNISLDPNSGSFQIPQEDTISVQSTNGFSKTENDTWKWDSETATPKISFILLIGDHSVNFGSNGQNVLLRLFSHVSPIVDMIYPSYDSTVTSEEADIEDGLSTSLDYSSSVTFESPAYPAEIQDYQPAREEHNFVVIGDFNQYKLIRDSYEINCISVPKSDLSCDLTELVQTMDMAKQLYAPNSEISELNVWEFEFTGFPRDALAGDGQFTINHGQSVKTWLHEFIHTEQLFALSEEMAWFTEASADYFDLLALLQFSELEFDSFYEEYADFVADQPVAEIGSKNRFPPRLAYDASSIVAALDAIIRQQTEEKTVVNVFQRMNNSSGEITFAGFTDIVAEVIGERLDPWLESNIREEANVTIPEDPQLFIKQKISDDIEASQLECIEYRK